MKTTKSYFILLFTFLFMQINAQTDTLKSESKPLTYCEQMPEYPGGLTAMMKYLLKNVSVSQSAADSGFTGAIHVKFVVDEKGKTRDVQFPEFKNSPKRHNREIEKQIEAAILSMPAFTPGKQNGKNVAVWMQLPVRICLSK